MYYGKTFYLEEDLDETNPLDAILANVFSSNNKLTELSFMLFLICNFSFAETNPIDAIFAGVFSYSGDDFTTFEKTTLIDTLFSTAEKFESFRKCS